MVRYNTITVSKSLLGNLGKARGCSVITVVIKSFSKLILCKDIFKRRRAHMVRDGALSHKIDYDNILNLNGHQNRVIASKVTEIFLNWWMLPLGGVASRRV